VVALARQVVTPQGMVGRLENDPAVLPRDDDVGWRRAYRSTVAGFRTPLQWQDWALPAALLGWAQVEVWVPGIALVLGPRGVLASAALGAALGLVWRRSHPLLSLAVVIVAFAAPLAFGWIAQSTAFVLMVTAALFACGRYARRPAAYVSVPLTALLVLAESVPDPDQDLGGTWWWSMNTLWVFALGAAFRHERRLRDQAADASEARVRAASAEERLRLAQDLHDVLSHSLTVVVVQAEVADAFLDGDAGRCRGAIRNIAATGRSALEETRSLVDLVREQDYAKGVSTPGLTEVPCLVARASAAGLPVRLDMGSMPTLPVEVTATAYRVVQESLTNVLRHAGQVPTQVNVLADWNSLVIEVTNAGSDEPRTDRHGGHGLRGMAERVRSCGGRLTTGPRPQGGFEVRAVLPTGLS
jgi:signal transduction histidine kinase